MPVSNPSVGTVVNKSVIEISASAPADVSDGRLLVLFGYLAETASISCPEPGFTKLAHHQAPTGGNTSCVIYYKFASAESGVYRLNHNLGVSAPMKACMVSWTGVDATTPIDAAAVPGPDTANSGTYTPNPITTQTSGAMVGTLIASVNSSSPTGYPTGYSANFENGTSQYFAVATRTKVTASAETVGDWTGFLTTGDHGGITFAIRAAAAGGTLGSILYHHFNVNCNQ